MRSILSAAFVFIVAAVAAAATYFMTAQPVAAEDMPRVITVSGTGEATARPDQATVTLGVLTEATTAREALSANNTAMQAVFTQLEGLGIPEENIQTSNFSVSPQYPPYRPDGTSEPRRIIGYQVSNMVSVKFDDLDRLGPGLDAIVSSGANQLYGISFSIAETDTLMMEARTDAVADARARAETLAAAAGVTLGRVLNINEGGGSYPQPVMYARAEAAFDSSVPVASGEQTISANVSMTFEIE